MFRRLCLGLFVLGALVAAPIGNADGPGGGLALQGGNGAVSPGGGLRYVALGAGSFTVLETIRMHDGRLGNWTDYPGGWGIPTVTRNGGGTGFSTDGRTLVLSSTTFGSPTRFLILDAKTL